MGVRLIATDLDGTLVRSDHRTISSRNRDALAAAAASGIELLAISGRQPYSMAALLERTPLLGPALCANGAVACDLRTRRVLFAEELDPAAQATLAAGMRRVFPNALFVSVREGGNFYVAEHGYVGDADPGAELAAWLPEWTVGDLAEVLAGGSVKLVVRDPEATAEELLAVARELDVPGAHPTTSGAPFLEIARAGVNKGTALARYCAERGIDATEVVALGDNNNDVEMLAWAGLGVAMGNAVPEALEVADHVTAHHDEDGFARLVERVLNGL